MIKGQDWVSMGKFLKHIGHFALIVSLETQTDMNFSCPHHFYHLLLDTLASEERKKERERGRGRGKITVPMGTISFLMQTFPPT